MRNRGLTALINGLKRGERLRPSRNRKTIGVDGGPTRSCIYLLHLGALSSLSLAQPIFDLLSQYPQFLVAHHAGSIEIWLLVLFLCVVVPGLVASAEWLTYRILGGKCKIRGAGIALFVFPLSLIVLKHVCRDFDRTPDRNRGRASLHESAVPMFGTGSCAST